MATIDRQALLELFERRWDHHSARAVLGEALGRFGLDAKPSFDAADLARLAEFLEKPPRRAEFVIAELRRIAGGAPKESPAAAPAPKAEAPKAEAAKAAPPKAEAPKAAEPKVLEVAVGGELEAPANARVRIVSDRAGLVRWGVDGWKTPSNVLVPAGSQKAPESDAMDSKLVAEGGRFVLALGPIPPAVHEVNFTVRFEDGSWAKDGRVKFGAR